MGRPVHASYRLLLVGALAIGLGLVLPPVPATVAKVPDAPTALGPATSAPTFEASEGGGVTPLRSPVPGASPALFEWGMAYIIYGPGDDTTHFMGEGASTVVDDHLRNITTFGGEGSGGLSDYTVNYNVSTGSFDVAALRPGPTARTNASFAGVPGHDFAVLFGGLTSLASQESANDTWVYYFANQTWQNVTHRIAPPPRESAAFAVNGSGGSALLEGGWDAHYVVNGSTATVVWNDTWSLDLTTFDWSQLHPSSSPAPLYGSGMIWQNGTGTYDLVGGCSIGCSSGLWSFSGTPGNWHPVRTQGSPSARAAPAWVWDSANGLGILFGGFSWSGSGATALGDGFTFDPLTSTWAPLLAGGGPGPRYDAANVWADFPGCVGLNLVGGNIVLTGPPENASVLQPVDAPSPNCFPYLISGGGPPPTPCSVAQSPLQLRVVDNVTGRGVPDATLQLHGGCVTRTASTDALGYLNLSIPAPDNLSLAASAPGYRPNEIEVPFLPNSTVEIVLPLAPEPSLHVRTWEVGASGQRLPLAGVTIAQGNAVVLGTSNAFGFLNVSHVYAPGGILEVVGSRANFSTATTALHLPYAGVTATNLTLLAAGDLDIRIVGGVVPPVPFGGTIGTLVDNDPGAGPPIRFQTNPAGWFNFTSFDAANYTISASVAGYFPNSTSVFHPWILDTVATLVLPPESTATLNALVRSSVTGAVLAGASVQVGGFPAVLSGPTGWANTTGIRPAGLYPVVATLPGYDPNYTWVRLAYGQVLAPYVIELRPNSACGSSLGCASLPGGTSLLPFGYLNGGLFASVLIIVAPAALLGGGLLYAWLAVRREGRHRTRGDVGLGTQVGRP